MLPSSPLIVDCHLDLAWNAIGYKRDLTLPLADLNRAEHGLGDHAGRGLATTTLPEMRAGGVCLCLAAHQVAVGSDLDGGFGSDQTPRGLTSIADLGRLAPILADRGYTADQVAGVLADNALRFLTTHLPAGNGAPPAALP